MSLLGPSSLLLKRVAASFKRVTAFSNVQQHAEIIIIHFTFILILFLPCLCWRYPVFQCVYKSSTLFLYFCLLDFVYTLPSFQYILICCLRHNSSGSASEYDCLARSFWETSTYKTIFSIVSQLFLTNIYFSIEANTKFRD